MQFDLLLKLVAAHLLSDFFFQSSGWVRSRNRLHFRAWQLYLHGLITGLTVVVVCGPGLWFVGMIIALSHIFLDGIKSFLKQTTAVFVADQLMHLMILTLCWSVFTRLAWDFPLIIRLYGDPQVWLYVTALLFLTAPSGMLVAMLTDRWRKQLPGLKAGSSSLDKAGMLIGIIERFLIFYFVLNGKFEAIGLLIAAKSLLRFNEKERPEEKTEYLLVGTLISVALAAATAVLVLKIPL
ncbi:MAG: DUF3307 domain-containing protein [Bacteroidota bacterium]